MKMGMRMCAAWVGGLARPLPRHQQKSSHTTEAAYGNGLKFGVKIG